MRALPLSIALNPRLALLGVEGTKTFLVAEVLQLIEPEVHAFLGLGELESKSRQFSSEKNSWYKKQYETL